MRRLIAVALLAVYTLETTGCYSWHQEPSPYPRLAGAKPTALYRVTLAGGRVVDLTSPHVGRDSLTGIADSVTVVRGEIFHVTHPFAVPLPQVARVEHRAANVVGTVSIVVGAGLLAAGMITAAALGNIGDRISRCLFKNPC